MPDSPAPARTEARHERTESARLDNFVDGAFAFVVTLLIISGGTLPRDVGALERMLRGVPAFAACFLQLVWFWHGHVRWRDSVHLTDRRSLQLSLLLVFFALIFVFPLHLVYAGLANGLSGGILSPDLTAFTDVTATAGANRSLPALFIVYGLSYACMAGTLAILYWHGARAASWPDRSERNGVRVRGAIWTYVATVGLVSVLLALALPSRIGWVSGIPGFSYFLLSFTGVVAKHYRKHLEARELA